MVRDLGVGTILTWRINDLNQKRIPPILNRLTKKSRNPPKPDEDANENFGSKEMRARSEGGFVIKRFHGKDEKTSSLTCRPLLEKLTRTPMLGGIQAQEQSTKPSHKKKPIKSSKSSKPVEPIFCNMSN
ncbi:hypothetical protein F2Q68_00044561 [Brassica cretica]|uniref:Uncharacterized protein n=1 Tax=Brassica cretica TaxID=69181 RepID=A0A8S9LSB0_BRACR|nr:hypothetical protein F2Q68_00044561 [Brassica cretica]